jgi:hypothetical protein
MTASWLFVAAIAVVLALPLAVRIAHRRFDLFEPLVVFAIAYCVMFVARPASMLAHGQLDYFSIDIRSTLPLALLLGLVGVVAFFCGYELRAGAAVGRALPAPRELTPRAGILGAGILLAAALTSLIVIVWPAGGTKRLTVLLGGQTAKAEALIGSAGPYALLTAMLVIPAALIVLALAVRFRRWALAVAAAGIFALALYLMLPLGSRTYLLPLAGGAVTLVYVNRETRPRLMTVAAVAVIALLASYTLTVIRAPEQRAHLGSTLRHLAERPDTAVDFAVHGEDSEMVPVFAAALTVIPSRLHYRYGRAVLGDLVTRPIPRQLWEGKPRPVEDQVVGAVWPKLTGRFQPAFTPLLFFYWDFGVAGVIVGMGIFGLACRTLYEWFLRHRTNLSAQLIFAAALWLIVGAVRNDPVSSIVYACFFVLPLVLLQRLTGAPFHVAQTRVGRARPSER